MEHIQQAVNYLNEKINQSLDIGLILGSGLGDLAEQIENKIIIPYNEIPNFPQSTVEGHKGQFVVGHMGDKKVIAMQGRFHYYEGYSMQEVVMPVRVMKQLGISTLIVTNAAGSVNESFKPGDLMIIKDHINFMHNNPLMGKNLDDLGPRFPDMSNAYKKDLIKIGKSKAQELGINIREGVYCGLTGPTYETPAEIKMIRTLGGDAVGMSTVPEVITAVHAGLNVLGISCITNMAAGILDQPLDHKEVVETSKKVKETFKVLIKEIIKEI
ncbi:purine-nucleoside phosphorylase [Natranaerovirga hydrolytica]|uniref:Purine nucleoside phosphorylase n=1 Tax=Natranaerovirga hydrolytica TaxID=680378 RepID=A0A4R1MZD3_9FIRM|nr:purine-nucleoside phosphorylase [Natranaerovirga hydrolytica]TCK97970.1 purine-nucleoside phosphorylase [Natranaerovirga hydrolytica]